MTKAEVVSKLKWHAIPIICAFSPDACHADMVTWALPEFDTELATARISGAKCKREEGGCWCGRYRDEVGTVEKAAQS